MKMYFTQRVPACCILLLLFVLATSCKEEAPVKDQNELEANIKEKLLLEQGLQASHVPMVYNGFDGHWTTTIYRNGTMYRYYTGERGYPQGHVKRGVLMPRGNQSVLCVIVDYDFLGFSEKLEDWEAAQQGINDEHMAYAMAQGYAAPIVQFTNTNVLVEPGEVKAHTYNSIRDAMRLRDVNIGDFDIVMIIDLDFNKPSGGWGDYRARLVKMGWFYGNHPEPVYELNDRTIEGVAFACYHHEVGHVWGWEHEWTNSYDDTGFFITYPVLFGWEDVDGDGVPEILDETPYGIE